MGNMCSSYPNTLHDSSKKAGNYLMKYNMNLEHLNKKKNSQSLKFFSKSILTNFSLISNEE